MDTIYLQGSEDVRHAGANMRAAGEQMQYVMNQFSQSIHEFAQLVYRLEMLFSQTQVEITLQNYTDNVKGKEEADKNP